MVEVLLKLEKEINEGGLTIRGDRKLDADLGKLLFESVNIYNLFSHIDYTIISSSSFGASKSAV